MAAVRQPFGFKPVRSLQGSFNPATQRFRVDAAPARSVFAGEPVILVSGKVVTPLITPVTAANVQRYIGIVAQCLDTNQKPLVFSQPTRGPFLPGGTPGYVDVYTDKSNIYWAATDATASDAVVGKYASVTAANSGASNNSIGRSSMCINVADVSASAISHHPFFVVGPAQAQRDYLVNVDWTEGVEVRIATPSYIQD